MQPGVYSRYGGYSVSAPVFARDEEPQVFCDARSVRSPTTPAQSTPGDFRSAASGRTPTGNAPKTVSFSLAQDDVRALDLSPLLDPSEVSTQPSPSPPPPLPADDPLAHWDPSAHLALPLVRQMLAAVGRSADVADYAPQRTGKGWPAFLRPDGLDGVLFLHRGVYLTFFDESGASERYYSIGRPAVDMAPLPLLVKSHQSSETPSDILPLADIMGFQQGAGNPALRGHFARSGYLKGLRTRKGRTLHPMRLCFTLWFRRGTGFTPLDFAAVNDHVYTMCAHGFNAVRAVNTAANYTSGSVVIPPELADAQTILEPRDSPCPIL